MTTQKVWEGREAHLKVWEGPRGPPKGPGGFGRPNQTYGRDWEAHTEDLEGQESHPEVQEESGGPPGDLGGVRRPTQRFGRGQEAHTKV